MSEISFMMNVFLGFTKWKAGKLFLLAA